MAVRAGAAAVFLSALLAAACAHAPSAREIGVDGVDVTRHGDEARIRIRFAAAVRYLGYVPSASGESLRIQLDVQGGAPVHERLVLQLPPTDLVPPLSVAFSRRDEVLSLRFDHPVLATARAGNDGQSVVVALRANPGARDLRVSSRDWKRAPQPVEGLPLAGYAGGGNGAYTVPVSSLKQVRFATVVRQQRDWSCGSAAVATLLTFHYDHPVSERQALEAMFAQGDQKKIRTLGFSLLDIKRYLESLGFRANGFEVGLDRLAGVGVPAIVVINDKGYNHFVVVKGLRHGNVLLGDPARGMRVVPRAQFEAMWENRIVFVITGRHDGVAFNAKADWRYMAAPLGNAVSRESLANVLLFRPGANDF